MNNQIYRYLRPMFFDRKRMDVHTEKNGGISFKVIRFEVLDDGWYDVVAALTLCHDELPFNKEVTKKRLGNCVDDNQLYSFRATGLDASSLGEGFVLCADSKNIKSTNEYLQGSVEYYADIIVKILTSHVNAELKKRDAFANIETMDIQNSYNT